jgi:hypothetical protein
MNTYKLTVLLLCLAGLTSCTTNVQDDVTYGSHPSLGFSGPRIHVNGVSCETSYNPKCKNNRNEAVVPHNGVGIICEEPRQSGYSLSGPLPAGVHFGDEMEFTLKTEDGSKVLGRQLLSSGDVILIPSGSTKPVFISRNWNPPKGAKTSKILSEFRRLIAEHQAGDHNKTKSEQAMAGNPAG